MAGLLALTGNFVSSGLPSDADADTLYRTRLINVLAVVLAIFFAAFAVPHGLAGRVASSATLAAAAGAMVGVVICLRATRSVRIAAGLICAAALLVCLVRLHHPPPISYGFLWSLMVPLLAVFTLGHRVGVAVTLGYVAIAAVALYWPGNPFLLAPFEPRFRVRLLATIFGVLVGAAYVEWARSHTLQALRSSEHRFRSLIENSASVYAIVEVDGTVRYESPSLSRVYGYDPAELLGTNILALVHPDDQAAAVGEMEQLVQNPGRVRIVQTRYRHRDGSWRDIEVAGVGLLDDPDVRGIILTSHDVTERTRAEHELRELNASLEARVRERTDELERSEARLRQSEKMEAIGRLAGGIAHDFNNQLAAVQCCLDLVGRAATLDSRASGALDSASIAARRAAELTSQLLAFARRGSHFNEAVDVRWIVREVVALLGHSIDKRIELCERFADEPQVVEGDPAQLHSALLNLALNARDAMPEGGRLTFTTELRTLERSHCDAEGLDLEPGRYVVLSVSDTGAGLTDEVRRRIFEPFFTTKPPGAGTGMGLAAVYGTARTHHGAVTVVSEPGQGATFTLFLPASQRTVGSARSRTPPRSAALPRLRVLVVDDEDVLREMVAASLESFGHQVVSCADGVAAIEIYRRQGRDLDVVLLDMMMPRLGGRETYLALRELDPDVRVLLVSGFSADREAEAVLQAGAAGFLQKPFRVDELNLRLTEIARAPSDAVGGTAPHGSLIA